MFSQTALNCKLLAANLALISGAISAMNGFQMFTQATLLCELPAANPTLVSGAIGTINSSQMLIRVALLFKLFAAILALVFNAWMRRRRRHCDVAVSMRCVVGRADSCLVASCLEQNKQLIAAYNH